MTEQITLNITLNVSTDFDSDKGGTGSNQIGAGPILGGPGFLSEHQDPAQIKP